MSLQQEAVVPKAGAGFQTLLNAIQQDADDASGYAAAAALSKTAAEAAAAASAASAAASSGSSASSAASAAESVIAANNSGLSAVAAEGSSVTANASAQSSATARDASVSARDLAVAAKEDAVAARNASQLSAAGAAATAAAVTASAAVTTAAVNAAAESAAGSASDAADSAATASQDAESSAAERRAAAAAAESARASALAAGAGYGAAGDARVRLGSSVNVWSQCTRISEAVSGPVSVNDDGDGPYAILLGAAGTASVSWTVDLENNPGSNPLASTLSCSVVALVGQESPERVDASLYCEVLDASNVARAYVGAAESFGANGSQVLAAEAIPLTVAAPEASTDKARIGARRLRITLVVQTQALGGPVEINILVGATPYLRVVPAEVLALGESKQNVLARVLTRPGGTVLPSVESQQITTHLISGAGNTTLPAGQPDRSQLVVINDSVGTVTILPPAGVTLRGSAVLTTRGDRRVCLLANSVWYVG